MSYRYFTRKSDAKKLADAIYDRTGYNASIFRDGKSYRVQYNELGNSAMDDLMESLGMAVERG